jgi:triosephosphate isomerase
LTNSRKPVIAGNWKMHKTVGESVETVLALKQLVANITSREIVIAPTYTSLKTVADRLEGTNIKVAAQDCATEPREGPFTGEVSAEMIRDVGATHVIVGHSERRQFFCETDEIVRRKTTASLSAGLTAIVCVGESLEQRDNGEAQNVVRAQLEAGLSGLTANDVLRIIVAYEPVWAIGTGRTATPEQAQEMHAFIRRVFAERHSERAADSIRVLYGGSVKPDNISALMALPDVDGALVGGASLEPATFARIVDYDR